MLVCGLHGHDVPSLPEHEQVTTLCKRRVHVRAAALLVAALISGTNNQLGAVARSGMSMVIWDHMKCN